VLLTQEFMAREFVRKRTREC